MAEQTLSSLSTSLPSSSLSLTSLDSLIDFLDRSLYLINEFIERTANGGSNVTLGPRILLQCPLDGDQAKESSHDQSVDVMLSFWPVQIPKKDF
uniref:CortBP2/NAV1-like AAA+ ATPase lid domain-containing protein n=1 Tax=Meloidogyne floridensis TaxID=298350 RepID=A0A915P0P2_9BILA